MPTLNTFGSARGFGRAGAAKPNQVTNLTATDFGTNRAYNNGRIDLSWSAPANNGAPITGYRIDRSLNGSSYTTIIENTGSASTSYSDTGLSSTQTYYYKIAAINAVGQGELSNTANATATTVPQAPTIGTATAGNAFATVTYTANATGGKTVTTFTATSNPESITGTGSSPITVSGLSNGTAYTFTVTATNANGTSAASAASNSVTPFEPASIWTTVTSNFGTTVVTDVQFSNSLWVATGYTGQIRTSTDAVTWTTRTSNFGNTNIASIAYGSGNWVAVGHSGQIRRSTDAITWTTSTQSFGNTTIRSIAYGNGVFIASPVNGGYVYRSADGSSWTLHNVNYQVNLTRWNMAYGNGLFLQVGNPSSGTNEARTSTDGTNWGSVGTLGLGQTQLFSVAYGNSLWAVGGSGGVLTVSTDTVTWTTRNSNFGSNGIWVLAYGNGIWLAGGYSDRLRTSTDTITWVTRTSNMPDLISTASYGNGIWAIGGRQGAIRTSQG